MWIDTDVTYPISEIFLSINGETTTSGEPTIFIRLVGCNLSCVYCDTKTPDVCARETVFGILKKVNQLSKDQKFRKVCITGGEPLIHEHIGMLIRVLYVNGYEVKVETNGTLPILYYTEREETYAMDIKLPSSKMDIDYGIVEDNINNLGLHDEIKCVIANREDFDKAVEILEYADTFAVKLFSPIFNENNEVALEGDLVQWLLDSNLTNWKIQVQIHKLLNVR